MPSGTIADDRELEIVGVILEVKMGVRSALLVAAEDLLRVGRTHCPSDDQRDEKHSDSKSPSTRKSDTPRA
jgi:hypothetical protein